MAKQLYKSLFNRVHYTITEATRNDAFEGYAIDLITEVAKILSKST